MRGPHTETVLERVPIEMLCSSSARSKSAGAATDLVMCLGFGWVLRGRATPALAIWWCWVCNGIGAQALWWLEAWGGLVGFMGGSRPRGAVVVGIIAALFGAGPVSAMACVWAPFGFGLVGVGF